MSNPMNPDTGTLSLNRGTDNSRAEALESQLIDFPLASERLRKYDKKRFEKNARYNGLYQQHLALAESRDDHIRDIARDERIKNEPGIKWGEEDEKRLEYKRKQLARVRQRIRDLNAVRHPKAPKLTREESRCKEITDSLTPLTKNGANNRASLHNGSSSSRRFRTPSRNSALCWRACATRKPKPLMQSLRRGPRRLM
jgi:hypothetical protein